MSMVKETCCYIGDDELPCKVGAEYRILPAAGEDCYSDTYACVLHVGHLLNDNPKGHLVVPWSEEG